MVNKVGSVGVECSSRDVKKKKKKKKKEETNVWLRVEEWEIGLLKNNNS